MDLLSAKAMVTAWETGSATWLACELARGWETLSGTGLGMSRASASEMSSDGTLGWWSANQWERSWVTALGPATATSSAFLLETGLETLLARPSAIARAWPSEKAWATAWAKM